MENIIWRPVSGYDGFYEISDFGEIRSVNYRRSGETRKITSSLNNGYKQVSLYKDGKTQTFKVHRLVWESFYGPIPEGMQINHLNENKTDNRLENLSLVSAKDNSNWGTRNERISSALTNGKTSKTVGQYSLDGAYLNSYPSLSEAHRRSNVTLTGISLTCANKRKSAGGFIWKYE